MVAFDTFISYSRQNADRVEKIKDHLEQVGLRPWMDVHHHTLGTRFRSSISDAICDSRTVTPVLTKEALDSEEVYTEVKLGIAAGLKIVPVVLSPSAFLSSKRWQRLLSDIDWGQIDPSASTRNITDDILRDIERAIRQPDERKCPVLCIYHFKGGVGKTTIAAHLAAQLFQSNSDPVSVLMVDCDGQSNLSSVFLRSVELDLTNQQFHNVIGLLEPARLRAALDHYKSAEIAPGVVDDNVVHQVQKTLHVNSATQKRHSIIPNSISATKYGALEQHDYGRLFQNFQNAIQKLTYDYDVILLDCNPSATLLSQCALYAATDIIVPLRTDKFTTHGLENIDGLLSDQYGLSYSYGAGHHTRQLWTLINFADSKYVGLSNEERSRGNGPEAELLRRFFPTIQLPEEQNLSRFAPSLVNTRIPESGFLRSKPVETAPINPDVPFARTVLNFFSDRRAAVVEQAIKDLASEIRAKTKSEAAVKAV